MARWRLATILPISTILSDYLMRKCFETPISLKKHLSKCSIIELNSPKWDFLLFNQFEITDQIVVKISHKSVSNRIEWWWCCGFIISAKCFMFLPASKAEATGGATINGLAIGGLLPGDCSQNLAAAILL